MANRNPIASVISGEVAEDAPTSVAMRDIGPQLIMLVEKHDRELAQLYGNQCQEAREVIDRAEGAMHDMSEQEASACRAFIADLQAVVVDKMQVVEEHDGGKS